MNECKDCRYWRRQSGGSHAGKCELLSGPGLLGVARRAITTTPSSYYATVITAGDFGCADFTEKDLDETVAEE